MMKTTKKTRLFSLLLVLLLVSAAFSGCGKDKATDIMDNGSDQFAEGKEDQDYSLLKSARDLSELIDDYSGGLEIPTGNPLPPDQVPDDVVQPGGDQQITVVHNDDEYLRVIHGAMTALDEEVTVKTDPSYKVDPNELCDFLLLIERDDPLAVSVSNISYSFYVQNNIVYYSFDYGLDTAVIEQMRQDTKNAVRQAAASMDADGKTGYEIVCLVNDYLCDNAEYTENEPYPPESYTAYGAIVKGDAVCEGYSKAVKLLLNEMGVVCDIEFGECVGGGGHAWNLVKLDDKWYQLDVTWNDACGVRDEYLLTTDSFMSSSRTWDTTLYPACTDTKYHK